MVLQEFIQKYGAYPPDQVVDSLLREYDFHNVSFSPQNVKTIALYFEVWLLGGTERVILKQFSIFQKLGYRVVFFTDEPLTKNSFPIPPEIKVFFLPPKTNLIQRIIFLSKCIVEENIGLFYWHSYDLTMAEIMLIKLCHHLPIIQHFHNNIFAYPMAYNNFFLLDHWLKYRRFVDLNIVLSQSDELSFRLNKLRTQFLVNPSTFSTSDVPEINKTSSPRTILWLARLDPIKHVFDIIPIMKEIHAKMPDVKMLVIGRPQGDETTVPALIKQINEAGLQDHISFLGPQTDVSKFYRTADLYLSTSQFEGFGLVFGEALLHSLPVVTYDLPYLEYFQHPDNGIQPVPQRDTHAAAEQIIKILSDATLYRQMAKNARKTGEFFADIDFEKKWKDTLTRLAYDPDSFLNLDFYPAKTYQIVIKTMQEHFLQAGKNVQLQLMAAQKRT